MRHFTIACSMLVLSACGGGGVAQGTGGTGSGSGTGGANSVGDCPDLSGTWVVMSHCESSFIGMSSTVTQTGCSYSETNSSYQCTGTITATGEVTQTCPIDTDQTVSCTGQFTEGTMTLSCTDDCAVVIEQQ